MVYFPDSEFEPSELTVGGVKNAIPFETIFLETSNHSTLLSTGPK